MLETGSKLLMVGLNVGARWDPHYRATRLFTQSFADGSYDDVHLCVGVCVYYTGMHVNVHTSVYIAYTYIHI